MNPVSLKKCLFTKWLICLQILQQFCDEFKIHLDKWIFIHLNEDIYISNTDVSIFEMQISLFGLRYRSLNYK